MKSLLLLIPALLLVLPLTIAHMAQQTTIAVTAGQDLQAAINSARPGDTIVLSAGVTYRGPITLPYSTGSAPITITTSAQLPNRRITPADVDLLPKLVAPLGEPAIKTEPGANNFRVIGLEVLPENPWLTVSDLVRLGDGSSAQNSLGQVPSNITLDRVYIHGNPGQEVKRGIALNSAETTVINSWISEIHGIGYDTQAICGWNGPGSYHIINNYLEGAGENIMFGGSDPAIPNLVPTNIEIKLNTIIKPLNWKTGDPSFAGKPWSVKNLLELKNARKVLIEGNAFENVWKDAQVGFAILLKSQNQDGSCTWCVTEDVLFTNNLIRNAEHGINILANDPYQSARPMSRIAIVNNFWDVKGIWFQGTDGLDSLLLEHNTHLTKDGNTMVLYGRPTTNAVIRNNLGVRTQYGIKGDGVSEGTKTLASYVPGGLFEKNVLAGADPTLYPSNNYYPATLAEVGLLGTDGYLLVSNSQYKGKASDGKDPGVDFGSLSIVLANQPSPSSPSPSPSVSPSPSLPPPPVSPSPSSPPPELPAPSPAPTVIDPPITPTSQCVPGDQGSWPWPTDPAAARVLREITAELGWRYCFVNSASESGGDLRYSCVCAPQGFPGILR